ncbi:MAG: hypothetical protein H6672_10375 [Anaerolineaceae bacterium]|nr:hypothetical protein [Anaerolineaceae bacterium]
MDAQTLLQKRDVKAKPHLEQYAPMWIVDEKVIPEEDAVQFNAIFQHNRYGWVSRRYRYDGFNDVLYYKGQTAASESILGDLNDVEPYIVADVADIPNAYGG